VKGALPIVGVTACRWEIPPHPYHVVMDKYVEAVRDVSGVVPFIVPSEGSGTRAESVIEALDGLLLTGAYSNVDPKRYGEPEGLPDVLRDSDRDETTARLIEAAVRAACPILGICRGLQEMNVAFGGTLNEALHDRERGLDHREQGETLEDQYSPAHDLVLEPNSELARIVQAKSLRVNSLHSQGVDQLGSGLIAEAHAPDGVVEAIRLADADAFTIAVQWHPEWRAAETPSSKALFAAFGEACAARARGRRDARGTD
jgi:putative glutamine amidotransferase